MNTTIKERPILFSGAMVNAILSGAKTQTRRVIKTDNHSADLDTYFMDGEPSVLGMQFTDGTKVKCPYGKVGDRLWVRETFLDGEDFPCSPHYDDPLVSRWAYRADCPLDQQKSIPWKPSIFMPRAASRITLEITGVRVERLNEISEKDAMSEGLIRWNSPTLDDTRTHFGLSVADVWETKASRAFARIWDKINRKTHPWASNPYVWVIEFKKI